MTPEETTGVTSALMIVAEPVPIVNLPNSMYSVTSFKPSAQDLSTPGYFPKYSEIMKIQ
jgi:hypothetical protein